MRQLEFWISMRYLVILLTYSRCDTDIAVIYKKGVLIVFEIDIGKFTDEII